MALRATPDNERFLLLPTPRACGSFSSHEESVTYGWLSRQKQSGLPDPIEANVVCFAQSSRLRRSTVQMQDELKKSRCKRPVPCPSEFFTFRARLNGRIRSPV